MKFRVFQIPVGGFDHNFSYLLLCGQEALIVDPCGDTADIRRIFQSIPGTLRPRYILLTHSHHDHVSGIRSVKQFFPAPVCIADSSDFPCDHPLHPGERLPLGDGFVEVIATPGHTKDSVCYRSSDNSSLFTGDTLFIGECGFCRSLALSGDFTTDPAHDRRSVQDKERGIIHPCCTYPDGDAEISVPVDPAEEI